MRITDMQNAGRRGKRCRVIRFSGWRPTGGDETARRAFDLAARVESWAENIDPSADFDAVAAALRAMVADAALPDHCASVYEEDIRGIDAPAARLTAGVPEVWSGAADETGITLNDHSDGYNQPAEITPSSQSGPEAYRLASRVWDQVRKCLSMSEAAGVLRAAGCKLHYYCRMD